MAFNANTYGILLQVAEHIYDRQPKSKEKSNTVTVIIGAVVTGILYAIAYLAEQAVSAPEWAPAVVMVLGFIGTVLGVNQTKNGMTRSMIEDLNNEISGLIDARQDDKVVPAFPTPTFPVVEAPEPQHSMRDHTADRLADSLDALAKRFAKGA